MARRKPRLRRTRRRYGRYRRKRSLCGKAVRLARYAIRRIPKPEYKHYDLVDGAFSELGQSGAQALLKPQIVQGILANNRLGNDVMLHKINLYIGINMGTTDPALARIFMYFWRVNSAGETFTIPNLLQTTGTATSYTSDYSTTNAGIYKVLYDRTFHLSQNGQGKRLILLKKTIRWKGRGRKISWASSATADPINFGLGVGGISNVSSGAGASAQIFVRARFWFTDS